MAVQFSNTCLYILLVTSKVISVTSRLQDRHLHVLSAGKDQGVETRAAENGMTMAPFVEPGYGRTYPKMFCLLVEQICGAKS